MKTNQITLGKTRLAPFAPTEGAYFTSSIARLTAENVQLEAEYEACEDASRCKQIAREQNYIENRISFLRNSLNEMYLLR